MTDRELAELIARVKWEVQQLPDQIGEDDEIIDCDEEYAKYTSHQEYKEKVEKHRRLW